MTNRRTFGLICLAIVAGCGKAEAPDDSATAKPIVEVKVATAKKGDIRSTVSVTGATSPLPDMEAKVAPLAPGRIKLVFVKTGDSVRKGEAIATLDPGAGAGQVQQAQAALRIAESTLSQSKINVEVQRRSQASLVDQARLNVRAQQVALAKLRAGSRPQEISQARSQVAIAQAGAGGADKNLERDRTLFKEGLLSRKDFEASQTEALSARAALASAEQALSLVKQGNRPEDIRAGQVAVDQAQQQLRAAEGQSVQSASKVQDVRIAEGQVAAARGALRSALAQSNALTVYSPVSGTVVGRTVNVGESVDVTTAIATVVNLDKVQLLLNVPAGQIAEIAKGQNVEARSDSEPDHEYMAVVTVVNRAVDPSTNTVLVEAVANNPDHSLRDDGFVTASIVTSARTGVVLAPAGALVQKDDKEVVYVAGTDGFAHARDVKVGARDPGWVEVIAGLSPGERIVTTGAFELDDGMQIKVSQ